MNSVAKDNSYNHSISNSLNAKWKTNNKTNNVILNNKSKNKMSILNPVQVRRKRNKFIRKNYNSKVSNKNASL